MKLYICTVLLLLQCVVCRGGVWTLQHVAPRLQAQLHSNIPQQPAISRSRMSDFIEHTSFSMDLGDIVIPLHSLLDRTLQSNARHNVIVAQDNVFITTAARLLGWNNHAFRYSARHNGNSSIIELEYRDLSEDKKPLLIQVQCDIDDTNNLLVMMRHTKGGLSKTNLKSLLTSLELALRENLEHSLRYLQLRQQKHFQLQRETDKSVEHIQKEQLEKVIAPECRSLKVDRSRIPSRMMTMRQMRRQSPPVLRSS